MKDSGNRNKNRRPRRGPKSGKKVFNPGSGRNYGATGYQKPDVFPDLGVPGQSRKPKPQAKKAPPPKPHKKEYKIIDNIDPVELFCAYHLGITHDDKYHPQNINDVSRRFNSSPAKIKQILAAYDIDPESVMSTDFDMSMAQLDIKVAPEGISKKELGRQLYQEYRESPRIVRNWEEELQADAEANRQIFEKLK